MREFDEKSITQAVIGRLGECDDTRFKRIMTSLITHLHDFVRDVQLTESEWLTAIQFLTDTGRTCTEKRQEFILLSDTLGVSVLVITLQPSRGPGQRRVDRPGSVLLGRGSRSASRQQSCRGSEGRARVLLRTRAQRGWPADRKCAARYLVGGWRRQLRHADSRRDGNEGSRKDSHRRAGTLLVSVAQADILSGTDRWTGGTDAAQDGAPSVSPRPHPHDRLGAWTLAGDHAPVRCRKPVPRFRCGVRNEGVAGGAIRSGTLRDSDRTASAWKHHSIPSCTTSG